MHRAGHVLALERELVADQLRGLGVLLLSVNVKVVMSVPQDSPEKSGPPFRDRVTASKSSERLKRLSRDSDSPAGAF